MFFTATPASMSSSLRRPAFVQPSRTVERFMNDALAAARQQSGAYTQDETAYTLTLDMPGIAKEQLSIAIEGPLLRIQSKEGAPRNYRVAYEFPQDLDSAASQAKLELGVLTLTLVKKVPISNAAELTIQ